MCLRNLILHNNIKRFIVPLLEKRNQICTTYIFPFKTPLPQHHVSTQCHDNMPVRPSSRWWRLSLSGKWPGWRSRWLSDGVFPPESRPSIQVPEAPLVRSLPPSSSPFHTASRGQTRAWTGTGRWTPRMKNLEKRESEAQLQRGQGGKTGTSGLRKESHLSGYGLPFRSHPPAPVLRSLPPPSSYSASLLRHRNCAPLKRPAVWTPLARRTLWTRWGD